MKKLKVFLSGRSGDHEYKAFLFRLLILISILTFIPNFCQDRKNTEAMLKEHGYEIIEVDGYAWFNCPAHTTFYHTKFIVKDKKTGKPLHGCYCTGFTKRIVLDEDGNF